MWAAVAGGANWGGANVWVSYDGSTYEQVGVISGGARYGSLTASFAAGSDPDTTHTLSVDLSPSNGSLTSAAKAVADSSGTLCPDQRQRSRAGQLRNGHPDVARPLQPDRLHPARRPEHADRRPQRRRAVHPPRSGGLRLPVPGDPGRQVDLREVPELQPLGRRADAAFQLHRLLGDPGPAGRAGAVLQRLDRDADHHHQRRRLDARDPDHRQERQPFGVGRGVLLPPDRNLRLAERRDHLERRPASPSRRCSPARPTMSPSPTW